MDSSQVAIFKNIFKEESNEKNVHANSLIDKPIAITVIVSTKTIRRWLHLTAL